MLRRRDQDSLASCDVRVNSNLWWIQDLPDLRDNTTEPVTVESLNIESN